MRTTDTPSATPASMFLHIKGLLNKGHVVKANGYKVTKEGAALRYKGVRVTKSQWDALVGNDVNLEILAGPHPELAITTSLFSKRGTWSTSYTEHNGVKVSNIPAKTKVLVVPLDMISSCHMSNTREGTNFTIVLSSKLDSEFMESLAKRVKVGPQNQP